jgi:hypothetical protein
MEHPTDFKLSGVYIGAPNAASELVVDTLASGVNLQIFLSIVILRRW